MPGRLTPSKGPKALEQVLSQRHTEKSTFSKMGKLFGVAIRRLPDALELRRLTISVADKPNPSGFGIPHKVRAFGDTPVPQLKFRKR